MARAAGLSPTALEAGRYHLTRVPTQHHCLVTSFAQDPVENKTPPCTPQKAGHSNSLANTQKPRAKARPLWGTWLNSALHNPVAFLSGSPLPSWSSQIFGDSLRSGSCLSLHCTPPARVPHAPLLPSPSLTCVCCLLPPGPCTVYFLCLEYQANPTLRVHTQGLHLKPRILRPSKLSSLQAIAQAAALRN